jgi:hypothetical protein
MFMPQFSELQRQIDALALQMATLPDYSAVVGELQKAANKTKAARVTTGSIAAGATALVTLTWASAFLDANYTVQASVMDATAGTLSLSVVHIETISASAVAVRVQNSSAGDLTGMLHVTAVHD